MLKGRLGLETARIPHTDRHGLLWLSRGNPGAADLPNQAINHAASAVEAAAAIAVAATATIPQLGFIHEDSSNAFVLDIADLFRDQITLPVAFQAVRQAEKNPDQPLERLVRRLAGRTFQQERVINAMIDRIKELFDAHDRDRNP